MSNKRFWAWLDSYSAKITRAAKPHIDSISKAISIFKPLSFLALQAKP